MDGEINEWIGRITDNLTPLFTTLTTLRVNLLFKLDLMVRLRYLSQMVNKFY
jgi:hypothetical protein